MKYIENPDADDLPDSLVWLYNFWNGLKGDRDLPSRRDFGPQDLVKILPNVALVNVGYDPLSFRCRLVGTQIVNVLGFDPTGKSYDEFLSPEIHERTSWCAENRKPLAAIDKPLNWESDDYDLYSILNLPLAEEGEPVNMILMQMGFHSSGRPRR